MLPRPDERLLGDVLGGAVVGDDRPRQPEHAPLEARTNADAASLIAGRQPGHERIVGNCPH